MMTKYFLPALFAAAILLLSGCGNQPAPEPLAMGIGDTVAKGDRRITVRDVQIKNCILSPEDTSTKRSEDMSDSGKLFLDLVLDVSGPEDKALHKTDVERLVSVSVTADENHCSSRNISVEARKEDEEGETFSRVHFGIQVPEESWEYQVTMKVGDQPYQMKFSRDPGPEGREWTGFGQPFEYGGGELVLNQADYVEKLVVGRYIGSAAFSTVLPVGEGEIFLRITGELSNPGTAPIAIPLRKFKGFSILEDGSGRPAFMEADRYVDGEEILLEPGAKTRVFIGVTVPKEARGQAPVTAVARGQSYLYIRGEALEYALEQGRNALSAEEAVAAGQITDSLYINPSMSFALRFPEGWKVCGQEETRGKMEAMYGANYSKLREAWDMDFPVYAEAPDSSAYLSVRVLPAEVLYGTSLAEYLESVMRERMSIWKIGVQYGAGTQETREIQGHEIAILSGDAAYTGRSGGFAAGSYGNDVRNGKYARLAFLSNGYLIMAEAETVDPGKFDACMETLRGVGFIE